METKLTRNEQVNGSNPFAGSISLPRFSLGTPVPGLFCAWGEKPTGTHWQRCYSIRNAPKNAPSSLLTFANCPDKGVSGLADGCSWAAQLLPVADSTIADRTRHRSVSGRRTPPAVAVAGGVVVTGMVDHGAGGSVLTQMPQNAVPDTRRPPAIPWRPFVRGPGSRGRGATSKPFQGLLRPFTGWQNTKCGSGGFGPWTGIWRGSAATCMI